MGPIRVAAGGWSLFCHCAPDRNQISIEKQTSEEVLVEKRLTPIRMYTSARENPLPF